MRVPKAKHIKPNCEFCRKFMLWPSDVYASWLAIKMILDIAKTLHNLLAQKPGAFAEVPAQKRIVSAAERDDPLDNDDRDIDGDLVDRLHEEEAVDIETAGDYDEEAYDYEDETEADSLYRSTHNLLQNPIINKLLVAGDLFSVATDLVNFLPKKYKEYLDKYSFQLTKGVMMARFLTAGWGAFMQNRIVEAVARTIGIVALPFVRLEDVTLATGLTACFGQADLGLEGKLGKSKKYESKFENFRLWVNALLKMTEEFIFAGFGKNRKVFPDLSFQRLKDIFEQVYHDFRGVDKQVVQDSTDQGHTVTAASYLTGFGALIGMLFGSRSRNIYNKIGGVIRNLGGFVGDYTLLTHPDSNMRKAGIFTGLASVIDIIQRFLPEKYLNTINRLNALNNLFGFQLIAGRTQKKTDEEVVVYQNETVSNSESS